LSDTSQVVQGRVTSGVELISLYEGHQTLKQNLTTTVPLHEVMGADAAIAVPEN
jgi:hypothetical protein